MFFLFFPMVKNENILPLGAWPIWPRGKYTTTGSWGEVSLEKVSGARFPWGGFRGKVSVGRFPWRGSRGEVSVER